MYWDATRELKGRQADSSFIEGLLNSLCFFPVLSYGATAPLAAIELSKNDLSESTSSVDQLPTSDVQIQGWEREPLGLPRIQGLETDDEDCILKVEQMLVSIWLNEF